jgi:hypothetical protein
MSKEKWILAEYQKIKYPNYEVSNLGSIAILKNGKRELICTDKSKRRFVTIKNEFQHVRVAVSRLLYCSFHNIVIPKGLVVDHKNNNCLDDRVGNYQLITNADNIKKYHAWHSSLEKVNPFKDWVQAPSAILRENNLYNKGSVYLGSYPTKRLANLAIEVAREVIDIYKVKNNDKIRLAIIDAILEYRESISIHPVKRNSMFTSKKTKGRNRFEQQYKYVYCWVY